MNPKNLVDIQINKTIITVMGVCFDLKKSPPESKVIAKARAEAHVIVREYQLKSFIWISFVITGIFLSLWFKDYYGFFAVIPCSYASFICCDYSDKMHQALRLRLLLADRKGPPHPIVAEAILKSGNIQEYFFNINGRKPVLAEEVLLMMKTLKE